MSSGAEMRVCTNGWRVKASGTGDPEVVFKWHGSSYSFMSVFLHPSIKNSEIPSLPVSSYTWNRSTQPSLCQDFLHVSGGSWGVLWVSTEHVLFPLGAREDPPCPGCRSLTHFFVSSSSSSSSKGFWNLLPYNHCCNDTSLGVGCVLRLSAFQRKLVPSISTLSCVSWYILSLTF